MLLISSSGCIMVLTDFFLIFGIGSRSSRVHWINSCMSAVPLLPLPEAPRNVPPPAGAGGFLRLNNASPAQCFVRLLYLLEFSHGPAGEFLSVLIDAVDAPATDAGSEQDARGEIIGDKV